MRVLVTSGSKMGGTAEIATMIGHELILKGIDAEVTEPGRLHSLERFDAAIVGGALYSMRWHKAARGFVKSHIPELSDMPVWFFSSGPLDASPTEADIPPVRQVKRLMERVGARGHITFGGRLPEDARGFPASSMAKEQSGDWRDRAQIRQWADEIAAQLQARSPHTTDHA